MFAQVIHGTVSDAAKLRDAMDRWVRDLAPGAYGWLGATGGVTDDGRFIAIARFESEDEAQRNSNRPEQGAWWSEVAEMFDGEPTFANSTHVLVDTADDPNDAGFVQVIRGRSSNPERVRELMNQDSKEWAAFRPDVMGSVSIEHPDGEYTMVLYFTSEAAAREGEQKEAPEEIQKQMAELNSLNVGEPEFFDLKDPWLQSAELAEDWNEVYPGS